MTGKQRTVRRQLFPEKLWELVNKPASGIQWSPDGKRIEVERTQLEKFIGTKFRSHNFDSFIRQLHFYGFRKCGNSYHHDKFQRGQPDALLTMKRKYSNLTLNSLCNVNSQSPCYTSNASDTSSTDSNSSRNRSTGVALLNEVIDLSKDAKRNDTTTNNVTSNKVDELVDNEGAIDYSSSRSIATSFSHKIGGKSLIKSHEQKNGSDKLISLYTIRPSDSNSANATSVNSILPPFTDIRQNIAHANSSRKSIQITIPELLKDTGKNAWPETFVLEYGSQNILSAYFIYRTN